MRPPSRHTQLRAFLKSLPTSKRPLVAMSCQQASDAAVERLVGLVRSGDRILVKGSRSAGLEGVPELLAERLGATG